LIGNYLKLLKREFGEIQRETIISTPKYNKVLTETKFIKTGRRILKEFQWK